MTQLLDLLLIVALALNFCALGVSRIRAVINTVALQGILLGIVTLFVHTDLEVRTLILVAGMIALKGFIIPNLLRRAMRDAEIQHEVRPYVGFTTSLLLGAVGTGLAIVFASNLPLVDEHAGKLLVPAALATVWTGFLLLTLRTKAIMQVLGYLLLENGIFLFGLLLLEAIPLLVEVGVLLDLFTGVFVMGIIIHHISLEFASLSTEKLTELKEEV
jgi:hydrogenase-4 component E